jgi:integrase
MTYNPAARLRMASEKRQRPVIWTDERKAAFWAACNSRIEAARSASAHVSAFVIWKRMDLRPAPVMVWEPEDTGLFLDYAARHRLGVLFEVLATTGMRRGQICGLPWTDKTERRRAHSGDRARPGRLAACRR